MSQIPKKRQSRKKDTGTAEVSSTPQSSGDIRTGTSVGTLKQAILDNLYYVQGLTPELATRNDWYMAVAYTVRDRMLDHFIRSLRVLRQAKTKIACYLSAEFLMGPHLGNNLLNLGITGQTREALKELGLELHDLLEQEEEPGLGNGGLGRLAACYMDSLASLNVPAIGYGIRYEFGIFDQEIRDGWQVEKTDKWLRLGNPWEICRPETSYPVNFGGRTEQFRDEEGRFRVRWIPYRVVKGIAYDTAIPAYRDDMTDLLRLWKSEAVESFDFQAFNIGDYYKAVDVKVISLDR